ncbi:MAG: hypothetical protein AB1801_07945 [Chloroflexota bacterium]
MVKDQKNERPENLSPLEWVSNECYHFLGCRVRVRATSKALADQICRLMRSFPVSAGCNQKSDLTLSFVQTWPSPASSYGQTYVYCNDQPIGVAEEGWHLFRLFEWQLDIFLAEAVKKYFLLHAGAVAREGTGIILPGISGNGKSSLTLALVQHGFTYFSDELAVVDPVTAQLHPFPKPFSLKDPLIFPDLARRHNIWFGPDPTAAASRRAVDPEYKPVWYVHPEDVTPQPLTDKPAPIRYIIFPKYEPEKKPELQPLSPNQVMRKLVENSVNFAALGPDGLPLLGRLVKEGRSFTMTTNGPQATAELITKTLL